MIVMMIIVAGHKEKVVTGHDSAIRVSEIYMTSPRQQFSCNLPLHALFYIRFPLMGLLFWGDCSETPRITHPVDGVLVVHGPSLACPFPLLAHFI